MQLFSTVFKALNRKHMQREYISALPILSGQCPKFPSTAARPDHFFASFEYTLSSFDLMELVVAAQVLGIKMDDIQVF